MILKFLFLSAKDLAKNHQVSAINKAALRGCLSYLIGIKAFDKNGKARG
jgi:hypothetical protein